jgi:hypothetical protein
VQFQTVDGFSAGAPLPNHPRFNAELVGERTIRLRRYDAEGELELPRSATDDPVAVTFRSGGNRHSLEAAVRIGVSIALPRQGGLVLHASAVANADGAHVFLGESGAGKSTIAAMLDASQVDCRKISDELLAVAFDEASGAWRAHVTPFIGGDGLPHGTSWPVRALYFLRQATRHERVARTPAQALRELLRHVLVYVAETDTADRVLGLAAQLTGQVPCYELHFKKDPDVAGVLGIT